MIFNNLKNEKNKRFIVLDAKMYICLKKNVQKIVMAHILDVNYFLKDLLIKFFLTIVGNLIDSFLLMQYNLEIIFKIKCISKKEHIR